MLLLGALAVTVFVVRSTGSSKHSPVAVSRGAFVREREPSDAATRGNPGPVVLARARVARRRGRARFGRLDPGRVGREPGVVERGVPARSAPAAPRHRPVRSPCRRTMPPGR